MIEFLINMQEMLTAIHSLAETMGIDHENRPWRELFEEMEEAWKDLKASYDSFYEVPEWYDGHDDLYDYGDYSDEENDYFYNEGLDYIQERD